MLAAGQALIAQHGMTVSLEHISLEEIIIQAGVSRSSVYRRWPYREQYFADLLVAVANTPLIFAESDVTIRRIAAAIRSHADALGTPEGRRRLVIDGLRIALQDNLEELFASTQWRTYLSLTATYQGLPSGEVRTRVGEALARREAAYTAHRAEVYGALLDVIGYRCVPPLTRAQGLHALATGTGALMVGLVVAAEARPELITERRRVAAFGGPEAEWSVPVLTLAAQFLGMIEPDPGIVWNDERFRRSMDHLSERLREARRLQRARSAAPDGPV